MADVDPNVLWTFRAQAAALDGGWVAGCVERPGAMGQGETIAEALASAAAALEAVLGVEGG